MNQQCVTASPRCCTWLGNLNQFLAMHGAGGSSLMHACRDSQAIPIVVVVGVAVGGCGWYLTRLARGPVSRIQVQVPSRRTFVGRLTHCFVPVQDVVWNRHGNPEPWNKVDVGHIHQYSVYLQALLSQL
jgi:hypothetical protein